MNSSENCNNYFQAYTKQQILFGRNQSEILTKFLQYASLCSDSLSIFEYMEENNICLNMPVFWKAKANLFLEMAQFAKANQCFKKAISNSVMPDLNTKDKQQLQQIYTHKTYKILKSILKRYPTKSKRSALQYSLLYQQNSNIDLKYIQNLSQIFEKDHSCQKQQAKAEYQLMRSKYELSWMNKQQNDLQQSQKIQSQKNEMLMQIQVEQTQQQLKRKFLLVHYKGVELKQKILQKLCKQQITMKNLQFINQLSTGQKFKEFPYLSVYIPKNLPPLTPAAVKKYIIAGAVYPFDKQKCFQNIYESKRTAIQLFYAQHFGHPCAPINLRSYLGGYTRMGDKMYKKMQNMICKLPCDFSPILNCLEFRIYLNPTKLQKLRIKCDRFNRPQSNSQQIFIVEQTDQYLDRFQEEQVITQWFNDILQILNKERLIKITNQAKITTEQVYKVKHFQIK